jgi:hypothetical protein
MVVLERRHPARELAQLPESARKVAPSCSAASKPTSAMAGATTGSFHCLRKPSSLAGPAASRVPTSIHSVPNPLHSEQSSNAWQKAAITDLVSASSSWYTGSQ